MNIFSFQNTFSCTKVISLPWWWHYRKSWGSSKYTDNQISCHSVGWTDTLNCNSSPAPGELQCGRLIPLFVSSDVVATRPWPFMLQQPGGRGWRGWRLTRMTDSYTNVWEARCDWETRAGRTHREGVQTSGLRIGDVTANTASSPLQTVSLFCFSSDTWQSTSRAFWCRHRSDEYRQKKEQRHLLLQLKTYRLMWRSVLSKGGEVSLCCLKFKFNSWTYHWDSSPESE